MKNILITGGTQGIGYSTMKIFLNDESCQIFVLGRNINNLPQHQRIKPLSYDLTNIEGIAGLMNTLPSFDVIVHSAGIMNGAQDVTSYSYQQASQLMNINLYAPLEITRCALPGMIQQNQGRIIFLSSLGYRQGHADLWYGVSKAGLSTAAKTLAKKYARNNLHFYAVAPGPVETKMFNNVVSSARKEELKKQVATGEFTQPEDIAQLIYRLSTQSPLAMNGQTIDCNDTIWLS